MRAWATLLVVLITLGSAAHGVTYTWTGGGGANDGWSNASNWGGTAPADGETDVGLVFPALGAPYASTNDLTGLQVTSLDITAGLGAGNYTFTGNSITLGGAATMSSPGTGDPNLVWQIPVVLGGDVTISASGRQTRLAGTIDLGSRTLTLDTPGDVVLAGTVSGSGNLVKNNTSALTITGANTYTGSTTGNRGALYIASPAAFGGSATGTTFNGGFLGFVPGSTFTTSEPFVFAGGGILAYGTPAMAGQVTLDTTTEVEVFDPLAILTMSGAITGTGGLDKTGPGLLILNAPDDSYEGATRVESGTLQLDTVLSGTSPVTVESGASLKGNGSSGGTIRVQGGGTIAPGSSPGALSSAGLTMAAGALFAAEIEGPAPVTGYDTLAVNGPVDLGGATLAVALGFAPADGQELTLISQLEDDPVAGGFAALPEGATFQVDGTTFGITYEGGSGNDVVLVAAATAAPTSTPTELLPPSTPTETATPAGTPSPVSATPSSTPTPTSSVVPTPEATETPPPCTGDCDGNGAVSISELVDALNIALDNLPATACLRLDADRNDRASIAEVMAAVENALNGCPAAAGTSAAP